MTGVQTCALPIYFIWNGDIPNARVVIESTRQLIPASPLYPQIKILFHLLEARFFCLVAQFDDSIRSVDKGLEIARASGMHSWDFLLLNEGVSGSLGKGDLRSASEYLRRMSPVLGTDHAGLKAYYYHLSSWLASLAGDKPLAISQNEKALEVTTQCGAPCAIALDNLHLAILKSEVGNEIGRAHV